jgi:hypothetical protein
VPSPLFQLTPRFLCYTSKPLAKAFLSPFPFPTHALSFSVTTLTCRTCQGYFVGTGSLGLLAVAPAMQSRENRKRWRVELEEKNLPSLSRPGVGLGSDGLPPCAPHSPYCYSSSMSDKEIKHPPIPMAGKRLHHQLLTPPLLPSPLSSSQKAFEELASEDRTLTRFAV